METEIQQQIRLAAAERGKPLWRNNNGACVDESGRVIRYGLGNHSKRLSEVWKSSDLIGVYPINITPAHVGLTLGVFYAVEVKRPGFTMDKRAKAQLAFGTDIQNLGGIFQFATSPEDLV